MKKRALRKDFIMEIRRNPGRFISIFLIVALGVAFYSGIQATAPDMRYTGDIYYDNNNLMDLKVMGTMGMTEKDVEAFLALDEIQAAEPGRATDVLFGKEEESAVLHMQSLLPTINRVKLEAGAMPKGKGECLLDALFASQNGYQVGDVIEVREKLKEDEEPVLKAHSFTVTGLCSSPLYISFERGSTAIGSGEVDAFAYVTDDNFDLDVYTEVYLTVKGAAETTAYMDTYTDVVEPVRELVEAMENERCEARYEEIREEADEKLADARQELADGQKEADEKLADAKEELDDARKKLSDARKELEDGKAELADGRAELEKQEKKLSDARRELSDGRQKLSEGKAELSRQEEDFNEQKAAAEKEIGSGEQKIEKAEKKLDKNEKLLNQKEKELETAKKQYEEGKAAADAAAEQIQAAVAAGQMTPEQAAAMQEQAAGQLAQLTEAKTQIDEGEKQLKEGRRQIKAGRKEIAAQKQKLADARQELTDGEKKLQDAWTEINSQEAKIQSAAAEVADGERQIADGWKEIEENEQKLADGEAEIAEHEADLKEGQEKYEDAKADAEAEITDGQAKIDDAQKEIDELKHPEWYVSDRDDLADYTGMGENADRMRNIGLVFPVLFFLVAALISLTSMTRMVEEQRTQIGTLKALGYGKFSIAAKYLGYALLATIGGSVFGVLVGEQALPYIIIHAYGIMYHYVPIPSIPYNIEFALIGSGAAVFCVLVATLSACFRELAAVPAVLMRPPAPKQGKRVLLERVTFLWKHLSFTWKSTIRNLFRYKKRLFMTVFGISGCMALLLVGYGLRDSIMDIAVIQYQELQLYDAMVLADEDAEPQDIERLRNLLEKDADVTRWDSWYMKNLTARSGTGSRDLYLVVPQDTGLFSEFIVLRDRKSHESYELTDEGVVLTEKTATMLGLSVGDTISLEIEDDKRVEAPITAICENYMYHYAYMTPALYQKLAGEEPDYTTLVFSADGMDEAGIENLGQQILADDAALGITYTGSFQSRLDDMLGTLDSVIIVLIVSAGMLALVVLYNLNNININERRRELATIKVLGFYDGEVAAYVYRENMLLTVMGAALGCGLGALLHRFVIETVEIEICMFGRNINLPSFIYSILFTVGFSILVNFVMFFKLKRINMVESLKSVE